MNTITRLSLLGAVLCLAPVIVAQNGPPTGSIQKPSGPSKAAIKQFLQEHPKLAAEMKALADTNHDGKIGPRERARARQMLLKHHSAWVAKHKQRRGERQDKRQERRVEVRGKQEDRREQRQDKRQERRVEVRGKQKDRREQRQDKRQERQVEVRGKQKDRREQRQENRQDRRGKMPLRRGR